jgi:DNA-binding MarR family transcriptional regulator
MVFSLNLNSELRIFRHILKNLDNHKPPTPHTMTPASPQSKDHAKLADFILFSQREFLLNLSRELNRDNISFAQFFLLSYLASSKELTMTDIAKKMGHSTAAATGLVDRLEKLGYMERTHAIDDRRKVMVRVTSRGMDLVSRLRDELQSQIADAMSESSATDAAGFLSSYRTREPAMA